MNKVKIAGCCSASTLCYIDCGYADPTLIKSELIGHIKDAIIPYKDSIWPDTILLCFLNDRQLKDFGDLFKKQGFEVLYTTLGNHGVDIHLLLKDMNKHKEKE